MANIIPLSAAGLISLLFYQVFRGFEFSFGGSAAARMERFAAADRRGFTDRVGDSIVDRLGLSLESWKHELRWAQLGGFHEGKTVGSVLGRSILFGAAGIVYLLAFNSFSPMFVLGVALVAYYPYLQLRGRANDVREAVKRGLPEAAALIAAEMSAGGSAETAVARAATLPGPVGNLLRQVVQGAQQAGRLIFSRELLEGALVEEFTRFRMPQLEAFARQIDLVASKGAEGPRQMGEVARGLAREYRSDVARSAEQLGNKLLFPVSLYIFVPFMLAIFVPLMVSVFESF
jgi:Flp pilus assembly protein TadB